MGLVPPEAIKQVADVLSFGAKKYGRDNWRGGMDHSRLYDATLRHIYSYIDGEDIDPESGKEHLAHAACGILMLLESRLKGYGKDDRHKS